MKFVIQIILDLYVIQPVKDSLYMRMKDHIYKRTCSFSFDIAAKAPEIPDLRPNTTDKVYSICLT